MNRLIPYGILSQVEYKGKLIYCMLVYEGTVDRSIWPGFSQMYFHTGGAERYVPGSIQRIQEAQIVIGRDPMEPRLEVSSKIINYLQTIRQHSVLSNGVHLRVLVNQPFYRHISLFIYKDEPLVFGPHPMF